ncbi:MAG: DUF4178 domain-containing protein [Sphingomonadales bacterium]|nr:DUF4178 domain-containing protein [Sphingomonadales bacterium]
MTPAPSARQVQCPSCGGTIAIKAAGYSVSVACQYCGSLLDVANPDVKLIEEYHQAAADLELPLSARGTLDGVVWEVIGALARSDDETSWSEFLLFNPYAGYRWLVHAEDRWTFGTMLTDLPGNAFGDAVTWRGQRYTAEYDPADTRTDRVVGEFYWRVRAGDTVEATTFAGYGGILSLEISGDETNWTQLTPLARGAVEAAFGAGGQAASPGGFGRKGLVGGAAAAAGAGATMAAATAPREAPAWLADKGDAGPKNPLRDAWHMFLVGLGTLIACIVIMAMFGATSGSAAIQVSVTPEAAEQTFTVGTVTITRPYQAVSVTAQATGDNFVNKWVDLDYSLVDRKTQKAINAYGLVEYYRGRDSDGDWTEGSRSTTTKFAGVPAGTYDLMVDVAAHNWNGGTSSYGSGSTGSAWGSAWGSDAVPVTITLARGGFFLSNLMLWLLLLLVPPGFMIWRAVKRAQGGSGGYDFDDDDD